MPQAKKNQVIPKANTDVAVLASDVGVGTENIRTEDMSVPFIYVLQPLSPEVNKRDGAYIKGAEPGFILNKSFGKIYSGEDGVLIVPCHYSYRVTEWIPRASGGGFVADHGSNRELVRATPRDKATGRMVLPNGNELVDAAVFYCLILEDMSRVVVPMSSTNWKPARQWNTTIASQRIQIGNDLKPAPIYANVYRLTTVARQNEKGNWFAWDVALEQGIQNLKNVDKVLGEARAYYKAASAGAIQVKDDQDIPF